MKSIKIYLLLIVFSVGLASCGTPPRPPKPPRPPGQRPMPPRPAKKFFAINDAKPIAPEKTNN